MRRATISIEVSNTDDGQPAESFDEGRGALGDLLGELDHVDASEDDVVGHHGIGAGKWRAAGRKWKSCFPQSPKAD